MPVLLTKPTLATWALIAEIASAVALVVSVVYLARQITDNTRLLRSQAHFNALTLAQRPLEIMVENESLAGAVIQCDANPDAVAAASCERCLNYYFMQFNAWEYMYYQNRDESIPRELWNGADAYFKILVETKPGYVKELAEARG